MLEHILEKNILQYDILCQYTLKYNILLDTRYATMY